MARTVLLSALVTSPQRLRDLLRAIERREVDSLQLTLRFGADVDDALPALVIESDGRAFVTPSGVRVDLRRSPVLRALLVALALARRDRPGHGCARETLAQACWPGLRLAPRAAGNRLRVAISTLRSRGLRSVLLRDADGWLIDPSVRCEIIER